MSSTNAISRAVVTYANLWPDWIIRKQEKLEQLERMRSEDTPRRLMITHTIESYWIPSQKKTKSKLQIKKIRQNFKFFNFETGITRDTLS